MLTEKEFFYVRHGQTDWNLDRRMQGRTDVPLNAEGRRQAEQAASTLAGQHFASICSSPLSRAHETAEIIQRQSGGDLIILDDLAECAFGAGEGELRGEWFEAWKRGETLPDGAEPYQSFLMRSLGAINDALNYPGPVLIVAHGGVYWTVQIHALRSLDKSLPNAEIIRHQPPTSDYPWWRASKLGN